MKAESTTKRLFFGCEISAPWPITYPKGRILDSNSRHLTLAFLGNISFPVLQDHLKGFPAPSFQVGLVGAFDKCLLLPKANAPHVVAWHAHTFHHTKTLNQFANQLAGWLRHCDYSIDQRPFLPHVTIARSPFDANAWKLLLTTGNKSYMLFVKPLKMCYKLIMKRCASFMMCAITLPNLLSYLSCSSCYFMI